MENEMKPRYEHCREVKYPITEWSAKADKLITKWRPITSEDNAEDMISFMEERGWELVSVVPCTDTLELGIPTYKYSLYFKRPLTESEDE
jgi:hypothetical protein